MALSADGRVLLEKRPESGVWAGLWCFPQFETLAQLQSGFASRFGYALTVSLLGDCFKHSFSHYHLLITPVQVAVSEGTQLLSDEGRYWHTIDQELTVGVPAPVKKLLLACQTLRD